MLHVALILAATGCSGRSVSGTYVAVDDGRTAMLQITEAADGQISGDYSSLIRQPDGALDIFTSAVTGSVIGREITLVFRSPIRSGFAREIAGTIDDDAIALAIPEGSGEVQKIILKRADRSNDEAAAARLRVAAAELDDAKVQTALRNARTHALQSLIDLANALRDSMGKGMAAVQLTLQELPGIEAQYRTLNEEAHRLFTSQCQYAAKPDPTAATAAAEVAKAINSLEDHELQLDRMISRKISAATDSSRAIAVLLHSVRTECQSEPEKVADVDPQTRDAVREACAQVGEQEKAWAFAADHLVGAITSVQLVQEREKRAIETIRSEANAAESMHGRCAALK